MPCSIARQPLFPREARMGALPTRKDECSPGLRRRQSWWTADVDPLVTKQMYAGSSMFSSAPIAPEERSQTNGKRTQ